MQRLSETLRHSGHLLFLLAALAVCGVAFFLFRELLVPESYGQSGAYRHTALADNAAHPVHWQKDANCLQCHQNVAEERHGSLHEAVRCFHCHGVGTDHMQQAQLAAKTPGSPIAPAAAWDGNFLTTIDLFVTKDRKTCLSCHQNTVGMPAEFKKIDVAEHLEEMGASEPDSPEACFECHKGHNTAP